MKQFFKDWGQFASIVILLVFSAISREKGFIILQEHVRHIDEKVGKQEEVDIRHEEKIEEWVRATQKLTYQVERVADHLEDLKERK